MADALSRLRVDVARRFPGGASIAARFETSVRAGSIVVLFGPSGAGKTTVVRCIAGLERPDSGVIRFGDRVWFDGKGASVPAHERRVGYVGQEPALFPHLTARGNVAYGVHRDSTADGRVDRLLARLDLSALADRRPHELSGGQQQRVALARALAPAPRLVLLDEPFGALDVPARAALRRDLRAIVSELRASVVLVTHDRTDAIAIGDELIVLAEGSVRQCGPVLDVFRRPADLVVARTVGVESVVPARIVARGNGLVDVHVSGVTLRAVDEPADREAADVFACIRAEDVTLARAAASGASARNHLPGRITAIESEGALERVSVDCGFPLVSLITRDAREELALAEGAPIVAVIKATAVHLVTRD